ncbi:hypothetical protein XENOCAPTIV_022656 [Xenoophorus captivus]|uniref:Uncharacterized protein n=1 Tax=Xenoophorus captivus TaxID=1517983 RepID=A0ABV0QC93_9TELE
MQNVPEFSQSSQRPPNDGGSQSPRLFPNAVHTVLLAQGFRHNVNQSCGKARTRDKSKEVTEKVPKRTETFTLAKSAQYSLVILSNFRLMVITKIRNKRNTQEYDKDKAQVN